MKKTTLDILIPSHRASEFHLLRMLDVPKPDRLEVRFVIVLDNPEARVSPRLARRLERDDATLIRNAENLGASASRNAALDASAAEWALFWDDDVIPEDGILAEYAAAMSGDREAIGFVGPAVTPPPCNSFTRGLLASDILTFWHLPEGYQRLSWGITANLMVRRSAVGETRFLPTFPKRGGGEDIDFCLRVSGDAEAPFVVARSARVRHEWWGGGARDYTRFMRWAYGDSALPSLFPRHRYYNFPNVVEFAAASGVGAACALALGKDGGAFFMTMLAGALMGEALGEWGKQAALKGEFSPLTALESALVRASNDLGRFAAHAKKFRPAGMMERFDYFCDGKHLRFERVVAGVKFALFSLAALALHILV